MQVRFWISDSEGGVSNVTSKLYLAIWKRFRTEEIEIPFYGELVGGELFQVEGGAAYWAMVPWPSGDEVG